MGRGAPRILAAELAGTFLLVFLATGSIVYDAGTGGDLGVPFAAAAPFAALVAGVGLFGRVSMAHFNPAVTLGYLITGHMRPGLLPWYLGAELAGALLGSAAVLALLGGGADLGANAPGQPVPAAFAAEVLASAMLMAVVLCVARYGGLRGLGGAAIGGVVALDILLFSGVSGASMNPARSLAPALLSGATGDLWLYWSAPFVGTAAAALGLRGLLGHGAAR